MEQSPSLIGNNCSDSQEIHQLSWNQTVHYRVHKTPVWSLSWAIQSIFSHHFSYLILPSIHAYIFPAVTNHQVLWPKFCMLFSFLPCLVVTTLITYLKKKQKKHTSYLLSVQNVKITICAYFNWYMSFSI
jgi:hypothetical protein